MEMASLIIAVVGIGIAIYQTMMARGVKRVVKDWGSDILRRLDQTAVSCKSLDDRLSKKDSIAWGQSRNEVEYCLREAAEHLEQLRSSMHSFLTNVLGEVKNEKN